MIQQPAQNHFLKPLAEYVLVGLIILTALFVGFWNPKEFTHPLHGDLLITGNAIYNIHNRIPYKIGEDFQWIDERVHYFYTAPLYYAYAALFWNNAKDYTDNFVPSTMLSVIAAYIVCYLFLRRFFGVSVALLSLFLMSLTGDWFNYTNRMLYGSWAFLPGVSVLLYWLYFKFIESNRLKFMFLAGMIAGLGFYFVPWPLLVVVVPMMVVCTFLVPSSSVRLERRFFGMAVLCFVVGLIILAKEIVFSLTGLRYWSDPSGIKTFYGVFFEGRYGASGNFGNTFDSSQVSSWADTLRDIFTRLSERVLKPKLTGGLISPVVLLSFFPGVFYFLTRKSFAHRFFAINTLLTLFFMFTFINAEQRYHLSVFPLVYTIAAGFLWWIYQQVAKKIILKGILIIVVLAGVGLNIYDTYFIYMKKKLPQFSQFDVNCYNSIEWPFPALKKFLRERKTVYDFIFVPQSINHHQMNVYFRWYPELLHLHGESFGQAMGYDDDLRRLLKNQNDRKIVESSKVLIIANNYNDLLKSYSTCGQSGLRLPYDEDAMTPQEVMNILPAAKLVGYAGFKGYPKMYALFEANPQFIPYQYSDVRRYREPEKLVSASGYMESQDAEDQGKPANAFDGKPATFWRVRFDQTPEVWIKYRFDWPTKINQIKIKIGSQTAEAPGPMRIEASVDGKQWKTLGAISEVPVWDANDLKTVNLPNQEYFHYYRMVFIATGRESLRVVDINFFGEQ
jgi:hypothetical protein